MRVIYSLLVLVTATACIPPTMLSVAVAPEDVSPATAMLESGTGTIRGSGVLRQQGGGVVTCAGNDVFLIPATPSVSSELRKIFGGDIGYVANGGGELGGGVFVTPPTPNRTAVCDAQGFFTFSDVRPGRWHLMTTITWVVSSATQGGTLLSSTQLAEGARVELVLTTR